MFVFQALLQLWFVTREAIPKERILPLRYCTGAYGGTVAASQGNGDLEVEIAERLVPVLCDLEYAILGRDLCSLCLQEPVTEGRVTDCFGNQNVTSDTPGELMPRSEGTTGRVCCFEDPEEQSQFRMYLGIRMLKEKLLKIVTISRPPFSYVGDDGQYTGVIFEFLNSVMGKFNTLPVVFPPYDGNWGAPLYNGTWNGMIGQVIRKEADVGAAGFTVTYQRYQVIDFLMSFYQEPTAILIPPPTEGEKLTVLVRPLSKPVWGGVIGTILFLIPMLYTFHNISRYLSGDRRRRGLCSMSREILWFVLGSVLQQGLTSPVEKSTRFVTAIWWFVTLIIANTYIAFLVSYLSAPKLYNVVDSLEQLSRQNKIKWTFRSNTAHFALFKSPLSTGIYKLLGDKTPSDILVTSDQAGIELTLYKKYAFIKERSFLEFAISEDFEQVKKCRMTLAKNTFFTAGISLIVAKGNPLLEVLNFELSHSISTGLMEKWKKLHWPKSLQCIDAASYIISTRPRARKLDFSDVQGAYFLLGSGVTLAITCFIIENVVVIASYRIYFMLFKWKITTVWRFIR